MVPVFTTAALLVPYRTEGQHWWQYLDVIEQAAPLLKETVPAACCGPGSTTPPC